MSVNYNIQQIPNVISESASLSCDLSADRSWSKMDVPGSAGGNPKLLFSHERASLPRPFPVTAKTSFARLFSHNEGI